MKLFLGVFLLLLLSFSGFSQSYTKMFGLKRNGWDLVQERISLRHKNFYSHNIVTYDTTMNGVQYKQMSPFSFSAYKAQYPNTCFLREDTIQRKVFLHSSDSSGERIIYDFSMAVGDSINLNFRFTDSSWECLKSGFYSLDSIVIQKTTVGDRKFFYLHNKLHPTFPNSSFLAPLIWVEGTGCLMSPLYLDEAIISMGQFQNDCLYNYALGLVCNFDDSLLNFHNDRLDNPAFDGRPLGSSCYYSYHSGSIKSESNNLLNLQAFPNPSHGEINLSFTVRESDLYTVRIYDYLGKEQLIQSERLNIGSFQKSLNTKSLSPGIYFISISGAKGSYISEKILVD